MPDHTNCYHPTWPGERCGLDESAHVGSCPVCRDSGEYETEDGWMRGCQPCLTGYGPHAHTYVFPPEASK